MAMYLDHNIHTQNLQLQFLVIPVKIYISTNLLLLLDKTTHYREYKIPNVHSKCFIKQVLHSEE